MKKILSIVLALAVLTLGVINVGAVSFSDLDGHWGKEYIDILINDGTINGYEDGTFRPEGTVTRAEFVKMIGKGATRFENAFADVPTDHWGYDYIMYSGLDVDGNIFMPDKAITRGEVLNLIWKRAGSKTDVSAPGIITRQSANKDAAAWGYAYGIMTGDDGLNLRLNDTLTRAEGAALIVRARNVNENTPKNDFVNTVSEDILKAVFSSRTLFDREYDPNSTFTNGEMVRAALRFGSREYDLTFKNIEAINELGHEFGKEFYVARNEALASAPNNAEFLNSNANMANTVSEMCYNLTKLIATSAIIDTTASYPDSPKTDAVCEEYLKYAATNGILFYSDGKLNPEKEMTMKEFACLMLQLDDVIGTQISYFSDGKGKNEKISTDVAKYPANYADYAAVLSSVPNYVYSNEISTAKAKDSYDFASSMKKMFVNPLAEMEDVLAKGGINAKLSYYPTLVTNPEGYFVYRIKADVTSADNAHLAAALGEKYKCDDVVVSSGDILWIDLKIKLPMGDLILFYDDAEIVKAFK